MKSHRIGALKVVLFGLLWPLVGQANETVRNTVDLNHADAATIADVLQGVGEAKAAAIVSYRELNGPFTSIEQLDNVEGIGPGIIEKNRDRIQLGAENAE